MKLFALPIFSSWLFYFMLTHFGLVVFLVAINIKQIWQEIKKIDKKIWLMLLLIFLFGFYLRNSEYWLGPHTDGYVAQESAHLWVLHGQFVKSCALGNHENCQIFEQVLAPAGYPLIIALAHLIFGIHSLNASVISAVLGSLTTLLIFLIAYLLFKKEQIGLYAALVYALIPLSITYSQTGESRPTGLFFAGLAALFFLLAIKNNKTVTWLAAIASASYAIYVRQESYILALLFAIFFIILKWTDVKRIGLTFLKDKKIDWQAIWPLLTTGSVFFILQIPVLNWLLFNNPYNSYQGGGFFALNIKGALMQMGALMLQFLNQSPTHQNIFHYNVVISIIFFIAFIYLCIKSKKEEYFILGFFLSYFVVYGLMVDANITGSGQLTGDYFRRSTMFCLPYAVIAGYGVHLLNPFKKNIYLPLVLSVLFLTIIFSGSLALPPLAAQVSSERYDFWTNFNFYFPSGLFRDARATKTGDKSLIYPDTDYWQAIAETPNHCLVAGSQYLLTTNDYFPDNQRATLSIDLIFDGTEKLFKEKMNASDCLVYLEDYRCAANYRGNEDYGCQFLKKYFDKKFIFARGNIKAYRLELIKH